MVSFSHLDTLPFTHVLSPSLYKKPASTHTLLNTIIVTQPKCLKGARLCQNERGKGLSLCHNERGKMSFWPFWVRWRARFCSWLRHSLHLWDCRETSISMPAHIGGPLCVTVRPGHPCNESSPSCFFDIWLRVRHGTRKLYVICMSCRLLYLSELQKNLSRKYHFLFW